MRKVLQFIFLACLLVSFAYAQGGPSVAPAPVALTALSFNGTFAYLGVDSSGNLYVSGSPAILQGPTYPPPPMALVGLGPNGWTWLTVDTNGNLKTTGSGGGLGVASADTTTPSPGAPTIAVHGTPGTTNCSYRTAIIGKAGFTLSSQSNILTNCPNTLSATNYVIVTLPAVTGATTCYIFRDTTTGYYATLGNGIIQNSGQTDWDSVPCGQAYNDVGNNAGGTGGFANVAFFNALGTGIYSPGFTTSADGFNDGSEHFGWASSAAPGVGATAFGNGATALGQGSSAFGFQSTCSADFSTCYGRGTLVTQPSGTALGGAQVLGTNTGSLGVGSSVTINASDGFNGSAAVGENLTDNFGDDFLFGFGLTATAAHQVLLGSSTTTDLYLAGTSIFNVNVNNVGSINGFKVFTPGYLATAMTPQSSASCTNITGMAWNIAASKRYSLECNIPLTLAASATVQFCLGGPGTPTSATLFAQGAFGPSGAWTQLDSLAQTSYGVKTNASSASANDSVIRVHANIQNGATASGTALTLQTAANGTNNITVGADASCTLTQMN